ncbi:sensor histidine kinase [Mucilaginibacter flavus]|uniref:sensor histidine kinase n=1 Tax=Mucilaginibacter flavus TaxID=931504 RepID=UPI0025B3A4E9|nr:histidine kinase [Mucilaginibacter flavus]MDN3582517.1 histidine kinase [Mucilaginibacter flavus]
MFNRIKPAFIIEVFIHLLFWALIIYTPIISRPDIRGLSQRFFSPERIITFNLILAAEFYLNAFLLIPKVLKKHIGLYFLALAGSFVFFNIILWCMHRQFPLPELKGFNGQTLPQGPHITLFPLLSITAGSFAYHYLADQFKAMNKKKDITNASLLSELAFLRSQISPHFIFNVINSAVALSRTNSAAVEPTLIQLSKLLRYMLYVTDAEMVTVEKKEDYLRSYIQLQQLRFGNEVKIYFKSEIKAPDKTVEPMLLIPFVENAFKHGTGNIAYPDIAVTLFADEQNLRFSVQNVYNPTGGEKDNDSGIGLANVKRRLELLYPGKHNLYINKTEQTYIVMLQLELK